MTCLACSNNGAALNGLCIQIPNAIVWLCRSYVNSGNTIYFCPRLLKCKENKQGFHEKGNKKKPLCINCGRYVHCRKYKRRGYGNRYLLLAWKVSCDDCWHPSLGPATIVQGPCLDHWAWKEPPVLLSSQKPTEFKNYYHFYFGWGSARQMGFAVGHINSLSSPLAWGVLWQFDFFLLFFWGMCVCKWD